MNHASTVRVRHRLTDLFEDAEKLASVRSRRFPIGQQFGQCLALDQFHAEERTLIGELTQLIDRCDAWVLKLPTNLSFFDEPLDHFWLGFMFV